MMDINCDLGEGEPAARTRSLMRWITSANIACGGHAGDEASMRRCLALSREFQVNAGAHPGFPDRKNFGRKDQPISPGALKTLLEEQAGFLEELARQERVKLSHIKLHGALYHRVEHDARLARAYVLFVRTRFPKMRILASAQGLVASEALAQGVTAWREMFADRAYRSNGQLVARSRPGAVIDDVAEIRRRISSFLAMGTLPLKRGAIAIEARTICLHSDTPNAPRVARMLAGLMRPNLSAARRRTG